MVRSQLLRVLPHARTVDLYSTASGPLAFEWLLRMLWCVGLRVALPMLRRSHASPSSSHLQVYPYIGGGLGSHAIHGDRCVLVSVFRVSCWMREP
jgi:hypothetical protein